MYPVFQPEEGEHFAADEVRFKLDQLSARNQSVSGATAAAVQTDRPAGDVKAYAWAKSSVS
jgi:hypothetical protein